MTIDADEVVVGANGTIRVAPLGTAIPTEISAAFDAAWIDLGAVTEDGVSCSDGKSTSDVNAWQSFSPLRKLIDSRTGVIGFELIQWNRSTVGLAFGGGTFSEPSVGEYKYVPPAPSVLDERMLAVEWADGAKNYRLIYAKGIVADSVETGLSRSSESGLPISFELLGSDSGDPWEFHTDDPAFAP